jgi:acyl-CoA reductase-like NAD-dependent aldehyde dehydrogenase
MTSLTAWMMCRLFEKAGLPKGVVNMVFGRGASAKTQLYNCCLALNARARTRTRTR